MDRGRSRKWSGIALRQRRRHRQRIEIIIEAVDAEQVTALLDRFGVRDRRCCQGAAGKAWAKPAIPVAFSTMC
jgi:hypothetical protein